MGEGAVRQMNRAQGRAFQAQGLREQRHQSGLGTGGTNSLFLRFVHSHPVAFTLPTFSCSVLITDHHSVLQIRKLGFKKVQ